MEFKQAILLKEKNKHLLGKQDKGATIEELILVPTNNESAEEFLKHYLQILDGEKAIIPFSGSDVDIVAVFDKKKIHAGFFFHTNILNLSDELRVINE
ncbi:MAG: hypothetical protein HY064_08730 [Bacteroidetes bacterium]|nr:hypothetical protein [Bacteroidota bacterium]